MHALTLYRMYIVYLHVVSHPTLRVHYHTNCPFVHSSAQWVQCSSVLALSLICRQSYQISSTQADQSDPFSHSHFTAPQYTHQCVNLRAHLLTSTHSYALRWDRYSNFACLTGQQVHTRHTQNKQAWIMKLHPPRAAGTWK